ncbi:sensor histidine kinase [Nocardia seriolae]|uniref:sensor histidine kinase n=1 Tax=Nocardia seriolae TaxID=37332 RepID=UPI00068E81CF|nr:histidine kinase [Nocardia seriolae]MTJ61866.1 two-component sensor histidine kinase [Nocardia seriolae]MTJ74612.1 two-component sensor histidine kinase [Nocardia seriolae]MTJ90099.1 two-component sensor histidine kinase [Nocardia seriolae]MTK34064.1 two-component sensor histidine kinase [Nocardia seriolae]MTK39813.1 two-component sensor histidine kinase [Nocardia seriolae]
MNVTSATPAAIGQARQELREWLSESAVRARRFVRNPLEEYRRWVDNTGFDYPVSMVVLVDLMMFTIGAIAFAERVVAGYFPVGLALAALVIIVLTGPPCVILNFPPRPVLLAVLAMVAVVLFLTQPVPLDLAPLVLVIITGEIAAITRTAVGTAVGLAMFAELMFFGWIGHVDKGALTWFALGILFGWFTGQLLNYQRRYLYQERDYQHIRALQAAGEERRRIAREVHDVIAHSLSITLLHVTAARHALATDRDVDEAVDALADAERLGRQAMADIRRTVGLLDGHPGSQRPEPGLDDIEDLVSDFLRAGMAIDFRSTGDPRQVSAGLGLAVYRICQESLANIAKHAPGAQAQLRIMLHARHIDLEVCNTLPTGAVSRPGRGMGISGMRQRLAVLGGSLTAGVEDDRWRVSARIPTTGQFPCIAAAEQGLRSVLTTMTHRPQEGV